MADVSLTALIAKIRKLTGRPGTTQISNNSIVDYLNLFYQFDFPQQLKIFDFHTTYSFYTQPNQDVYTLSLADRNNYKSFEPPVFCSGYYINFYENREQFFRFWPNLFTQINFATGTGVVGPYTGTLVGNPSLTGNLLLSFVAANNVTQTARDVPNSPFNGSGTIIGDATGTINYRTGAISVTWTLPVPNGTQIVAKYVPYTPSRPLGMLFYDNQFTLRPVPDQAYKIELQSYIQPFAINPATGVAEEYNFTIDPNAVPLLNDYFQLLAYGTACKIFVDSLEMENYRLLLPLYQEQLNLAERKTMMQIKTQRTSTIYSENLYWNSNRIPTV